MIDFSNGELILSKDNVTINRNTRYDDINTSLYSEYGCNNPIYKKILLKNQEFYNTRCSIGLFFLNNRIDNIVIYNENNYFDVSTWLSKEQSLIVKEKNDKLLNSIIPSEYVLDNNNHYKFKWGYITSVYDTKGAFSSIQLKYGS